MIYGAKRVRTIGILDSGSSFTVFNPELAEILGVGDVSAGRPLRARTLGGPIDFYSFDLEMGIRLGNRRDRFPSQIGFFVLRMARNILGRNLLFAHYEIGFRESRQLFYLRRDEG